MLSNEAFFESSLGIFAKVFQMKPPLFIIWREYLQRREYQLSIIPQIHARNLEAQHHLGAADLRIMVSITSQYMAFFKMLKLKRLLPRIAGHPEFRRLFVYGAQEDADKAEWRRYKREYDAFLANDNRDRSLFIFVPEFISTTFWREPEEVAEDRR
jgi:hypothetical protein